MSGMRGMNEANGRKHHFLFFFVTRFLRNKTHWKGMNKSNLEKQQFPLEPLVVMGIF